MLLKKLGSHTLHCTSKFYCKERLFVILYHFRAKKRVDAGGSCLEVNGRPSVVSNKSLDDLKRTATLRVHGRQHWTPISFRNKSLDDLKRTASGMKILNRERGHDGPWMSVLWTRITPTHPTMMPSWHVKKPGWSRRQQLTHRRHRTRKQQLRPRFSTYLVLCTCLVLDFS